MAADPTLSQKSVLKPQQRWKETFCAAFDNICVQFCLCIQARAPQADSPARQSTLSNIAAYTHSGLGTQKELHPGQGSRTRGKSPQHGLTRDIDLVKRAQQVECLGGNEAPGVMRCISPAPGRNAGWHLHARIPVHLHWGKTEGPDGVPPRRAVDPALLFGGMMTDTNVLFSGYHIPLDCKTALDSKKYAYLFVSVKKKEKASSLYIRILFCTIWLCLEHCIHLCLLLLCEGGPSLFLQ
ncbi:Hypothetical predicted protein [Pelobates cultripes]|uniref:Uncharacterized protein n=1 Tax=Pelobates cultripes TaxID=61616 RepID=A0AAD1QZC6_PELCU|nr:Hypothetical predicted protein [Pelobates cultripes]